MGWSPETEFCGEEPATYLSHVLGLWAPTHLGHVLWALPYGAKELPGSWEVEILKVVQGVRVSAWNLSCRHLLQELPFKVGGHWAGFHQGDAGNRDRGTGSGAPAHSRPILLITIPLSFSTPHLSHHYFTSPCSPHLPRYPHFLVCPITTSTAHSLSPFPHPCPLPASQDVELEQLDSQTLEEPFQGKLGGCIDVIEHDT